MNTKSESNMLHDFISKARVNTWAGGLEKQDARRTASEGIYVFEEGKFRYEDEYFGGSRFQGEEIVYEKGKPIWGMVYFGGVSENAGLDAEEEFDFLKKALLARSKTARLSGVSKFSENGREYISKVSGGLENFTGTEIVKQGRNVAHQVFFAGGSIR